MHMGTLYLIATPIGNLEDITLRAVRLLGEVSLIAAEDTRHTRKLLEHYQIKTQLTSYFEHNKLQKVDAILSALEHGDVALVSDAGTPALNDPGFELVRAALAAGFAVSPVPGPSAPVAALVASGLPTDAFLYLGYLPRKAAERQRWLEQMADLPYTLVFLEAPHRLLASLKDLRAVLGNRPAAITRELTKRFEEIRRGTLEEVLDYFISQPPRGEFTLVIGGRSAEPEDWDEARLRQAVHQGLITSEAPAQLAARLSQLSGWPRRRIYELILELNHSR
jgi:16S rRNA (cytidine1402-2'-O)-methyltransferase